MTAKVNIYYFIHDWARPEGPLMGRRPISRLQGLAKLARSANLLLVNNKSVQKKRIHHEN